MDTATGRRGLLAVAALSLVAGATVGFVCVLFRLILEKAEALRLSAVESGEARGVWGALVAMVLTAGAAALAAHWVRRASPDAAGSGIPEVEAALDVHADAVPLHRTPVKFAGGVLAIGSGLALGREGPSVQMGAAIASAFARWVQLTPADVRVLLAAGAGAGLATAFNAPIAGAIFVLEELLRRFDVRTATAALGASAAAIVVARLIGGPAPEFEVVSLPLQGMASIPVHLAFGVLVGVVGALYARTVLATLAQADRLARVPVEVRAAVIGALVGLLGWFAPQWIGGGEALAQRTLDGQFGAGALVALFAVRFVLGPLSYASGAPGGLFAPMLVLGAQLGMLCSWLVTTLLPGWAPAPEALAIVGMAAFFTAVVRAPLTGITLAVEMTGAFNLLLPMLAACFAAMTLPQLLRVPPVYESLRARLETRRASLNRS